MRRFLSIGVLLALSASVAAYFLGIRPRLAMDERLARQASARDHPRVSVTVARRADRASEILLPASLLPFAETAIYARTSGYVRSWRADIGAEVKAGETLATIESPEVDQQLNQARAGLEQARSNLELARKTSERWAELGRRNAVSREEVDQRAANYAVSLADLKAAQAEVDRLGQLQAFETVAAPFDGVITARQIDVGTLITAGGRELFHIAQSHVIRVHASVPQNYVRFVVDGLPAEVLVPEFPGRAFAGRISRHAGALDPSARTLLVEVQISNPGGELLPGMAAELRLRLPAAGDSLVVPSNTLVFSAGETRVATVGEGGRIAFRKVSLGRDFGTSVEITGGITEGARLVANPDDSLAEGMVVEPLTAPAGTKG